MVPLSTFEKCSFLKTLSSIGQKLLELPRLLRMAPFTSIREGTTSHTALCPVSETLLLPGVGFPVAPLPLGPWG